MTDNKPSRNEEEYFAKREAELLKQRQAAAAQAAAATERRSHFMKCPKCGADLVTEQYHEIDVDRCPECGGVWFDAGEVEGILEKEKAGIGGIFKSILQGVRRT